MVAWIRFWDFIIAKVMKFQRMFYEQQQHDMHILANLDTQKHHFKVRSNALGYTKAFHSIFN